MKGDTFRGTVADRSEPIGGNLRLRRSLSFCHTGRHGIGDAKRLPTGILGIDHRESLSGQWSKNGAHPIETPIVALLRWQIREPARKVIFHVLVNLADGRALFDGPKHVNRQYLLVGKLRTAIVALPLGRRSESASEPTGSCAGR